MSTPCIEWNNYRPGDHRAACPKCSRRPTDKTMGVTILSDDHGVAHCFRCGVVEKRREERQLSAVERQAFARRMQALRQQHDHEQRQRQAEAATAAAIRWAAARVAAVHPYLNAKGVRAHGIRVESSSTLLVPVRDVAGTLRSLQSISADGEKRFVLGGRIKGCYHAIGKPSGRLVVCEGYATGATIREDSGHAVAIAFNAGNLLPVALALRAKFPRIALVIAADDDWKTEGNPGLTAATEAARAVNGLLAVPNFEGLPRGDGDSDFNDLHSLAGMEVSA